MTDDSSVISSPDEWRGLESRGELGLGEERGREEPMTGEGRS